MTKQELIEKLSIITTNDSPHIVIDIPYCDANHPENVFNSKLYKSNAPFVLHKDLKEITLTVASKLYKKTGFLLCLKDALRPIESQVFMNESPLVRNNPDWENILVSAPGSGAHPRGCAVDVTLVDQNKEIIDMGTPFDYFTEDLDNNPAARDYKKLSAEILTRRNLLTKLFKQVASDMNLNIHPLSSEWWDFRFPLEQTKDLPALSNEDLPDQFKML